MIKNLLFFSFIILALSSKAQIKELKTASDKGRVNLQSIEKFLINSHLVYWSTHLLEQVVMDILSWSKRSFWNDAT